MITPYLSQQPIDDFGLRFSDLKFNALVAVTTDTALTIPGNAPRYKAVIKVMVVDAADNGVSWVAINATAAPPAGATFAATTSELLTNQAIGREVKAGDVLHFYSTAATNISVALYSVGTNN